MSADSQLGSVFGTGLQGTFYFVFDRIDEIVHLKFATVERGPTLDQDRAMNRPPVPVERVLPLALGLVGGLAALAFTGFPRDDALITYQYALRLAGGMGFSYQDGPPVCGTSTPLWTLILAAGARIGFDPALLAPIVGAGCHAATIPLLARVGAILAGRQVGWIAAAMLALFPPSVAIAGSGMEASAATLLLLACLDAALGERKLLAGVLIGLLLLLRLDLALFAAILFVWLRFEHGRFPWHAVVAAAAVLTPWGIFAQLSFGALLPHSIVAKLVFYGGGDWLHPSATIDWFAGDPIRVVLSIFALFGAWSIAPLSRGRWLIVLWPLVHFASFDLAGTHVHEWYRTPPYPLFFLFSAAGAVALTERFASRRSAPSLRIGFAGAFLFVSALRLPSTWSLWREATERWHEGHGGVAHWLAERVRPGDRVACGDIGLIGFGCGASILDTVGLVSPEVLPFNRGRDYIGVYTQLRPEWAVIGTYGPIFADVIESKEFRSLYVERVRFPYGDEIEYIVYELESADSDQSRKSATTGA